MSDYRYETDNGGIDIRESVNQANAFLWIHEDRKEAAILIPKADIPTVAAELLKTAGHEIALVAKAYSDVVEVTPGEYECGDGPERAYGSVSQNPNWLYNKAANYIAIAEYIEGKAPREAEAEKKLQERRDELAAKFSANTYLYAGLNPIAQAAINYIIEDGK